MRPSRARSVNAGWPPPPPARNVLLIAVLAMAGMPAFAQKTDADAPPPPQEHPYTLHVYTDLLQVPALVLNWHGVPATDLPLHSFSLQIDSGPVFHPTAVHPEANEPLSLELVLDASGAEADLLRDLPQTPGHGFPGTLLPHDHIGVYAFDCTIVRSNLDTAADFETTHDGIAHVLAAPALHKPKTHSKTCRNSKRLWDAIAAAAVNLAGQPGRRAILVISDGEDGGSGTPWAALKDFTTGKSISVFVLRSPPDQNGPSSTRSLTGGGPSAALSLDFASSDLLGSLTDWTGGIVLDTNAKDLPAQLDHFVALLRSRYILQFPRPAIETGGLHHLDVQVSQRGDTVRAAGITAPIRDLALMNDPTTVPSDTSKLPIVGKHRPAQ